MRCLALLLGFRAVIACAQPPPGYYDPAQGLTGEALREALRDIISPHNGVAYSQLWAAFARTDKRPDGSVWDMYSDVPGGAPSYVYQFGTNQCGTYNSEGDCFNREHTFPVSWFGDAPPMNSDLHHIYPADAWVNQQRANWPYGTVAQPAWTSTNGSKRGPCAWPGCSGTVFEPIDAYKGDLARGHLYMLTRYMNEAVAWPAPILSNGTFLPWVESVLLAWHAQDPVSDKERARNDSVFVIQGNRNPYIDHPQWVTSIWGPGAGIAEQHDSKLSIRVAEGMLLISAPQQTLLGAIEVLDATGRIVLREGTQTAPATVPFTAARGIYLLRTTGYGTVRFAN